MGALNWPTLLAYFSFRMFYIHGAHGLQIMTTNVFDFPGLWPLMAPFKDWGTILAHLLHCKWCKLNALAAPISNPVWFHLVLHDHLKISVNLATCDAAGSSFCYTFQLLPPTQCCIMVLVAWDLQGCIDQVSPCPAIWSWWTSSSPCVQGIHLRAALQMGLSNTTYCIPMCNSIPMRFVEAQYRC